MSTTILVASFPSRLLAEQTARVAATAVPGTKHLLAKGPDGARGLEAAIESHTARSAFRGAIVAIAVTILVTVALAVANGSGPGVPLALGAASAATAAPFVGGLVGFTRAIHQWTSPPVKILKTKADVSHQTGAHLALLTPHPDRLVALLELESAESQQA